MSRRNKDKPKIRSSVDPVGSIFNPRDLPHELLDGVDLKEDVVDSAKVDTFQVLYSWLNHKYPTLVSKQDCHDVISGVSDTHDAETKQEIYYNAKMALLGYAMPFYMPRITTHLHMKNAHFIRYLETFVAESTFLAYQNMDDIVEGDLDFLTLPNEAQISGFYVRTPIQIWNRQKKRLYTIPSWDKRDKLLKNLVIGNVNVYIMRKNLEDGFECYVLFRGTSNEFNAIPQYGDHMTNTQLYRIPQYDPIENKFYPEGSNSIPLFYYYYTDMINNVMPHILQCLDWLHVSNEACKRIVVTGHSMGAALTMTFCYMFKLQQEKLWEKTYFRSYASPLCCNDAAVVKIEQWIIDSMQVNKYIEVVNTDDFVNVQYLLGGKKGLKNSIKHGTNKIGSWLVSNYWATYGRNITHPTGNEGKDNKPSEDGATRNEEGMDTVQRMMRIIQVYPEIAFSAFMNGALNAQIDNLPEEKSAGFRLGHRQEERKLWGSQALKKAYNGTLKVFFCKRRIHWQSEYLGKSHSNYVDLNMNIFWAPLRMYEDHLYRYYAKHGLRHNNRLRIVGMFPESDAGQAKRLIRAYNPPPYVPKLLKLQQDLRKYEKKAQKPAIVPKRSRRKRRHTLKKK